MQPVRQQLEPDIDFAFVEFGLSEELFLHQTPLEWNRRLHAWRKREERADRRVARICWTIATGNGYKGTEDDFIPQPMKWDVQPFDEMVAILVPANKE